MLLVFVTWEKLCSLALDNPRIITSSCHFVHADAHVVHGANLIPKNKARCAQSGGGLRTRVRYAVQRG